MFKDIIRQKLYALNEDTDHTDLVLYGDNERSLYKNSAVPVMKNLEKKFKNGTYDHEKAKKLWGYHADRVAQQYHKNHNYKNIPWHKNISKEVRNKAANSWADTHKKEMELGNFHD